MHAKVTIDLEGTWGGAGGSDRRAHLFLASALLGIRHHLSQRFGLHWRAGGFWGSAGYQDPGNWNPGWARRTDSTSVKGAVFQVIPFFGPAARFYVGPVLWGGYLAYDKLQLQSDQYSVTLKNGWAAGGGIHAGWVLGQTEWIAVHFSILGIASSGLTVLATTGIGVHGSIPRTSLAEEPE
jgi:hypothetical protein